MIQQTIFHYDFSHVEWNPENWRNEVLDPEFLLLFRAVPANLAGELISHPAGLSVSVADFSGMTPEWRHRQNYSAFCTPDSSCRIIEASLKTVNESQPYTIGFPLSLISDPENEHEFALMFDGVKFQIFCDGIVMGHEFPNGLPYHFYEWDVRCSQKSKAFDRYFMTNDLSGVNRTRRQVQLERAIQYYTPFGSNTWVGDVVVQEFRGVFHVFYLIDRHHYGARNGKGMHEFWHLSTEDFINWTDHGPIFEITESWQSVGTGNSFIFQDKLHLSFGWHTERNAPTYQTANTLFYRNLKQYGHTGKFRCNEIGELFPGGASYVSSEDGIHFTPSRELIHYLENPCIFVQPDGTLQMVQSGIWKSDHLGDWTLIDDTFPPSGEKSFARNCLDCPAMFELDGWEYCMIGFSAFFGRKSGSEEWIVFVEKGWDPYDGTNVPMVAWDKNHRLIEGGWLGGIGWGSCLLLREIIALGNGRIGKRWIPETLPEFHPASEFSGRIEIPENQDVMLEFTVDSTDPELIVIFEGNGGTCQFTLTPAEKRAQWSVSGERIPSFREDLLAHPECMSFNATPYCPKHGKNDAKENLFLPDGMFMVRILLHTDRKMNAAVLDAEIAGHHTMASMRQDLTVSAVSTNNRNNLFHLS